MKHWRPMSDNTRHEPNDTDITLVGSSARRYDD
jgi:hypothetical protein